MTKGQFALLTAALGLVTMGGAGYFAYASTSPHSSASANGASANGQSTSGSGNGGPLTVPSGGADATPTPGYSGDGGGKGAGSDCGTGQVQVSEQQGQGAMGTVSVVLVFQNTSTTSCELRGYPGASLAGQDGTVLLNAVRKPAAGLAKSPIVVLAPGAQATAVLSWSDVATGSGCAVQNAAKLLVTPPNTKQSATLPFTAGSPVCSNFTVHPVLK
ncbi:MAG TPA: DUF4232 domain-containing protein [Actinospica sp.]|nr:DUF4232 domain-containing protein [Actinospica sp.]